MPQEPSPIEGNCPWSLLIYEHEPCRLRRREIEGDLENGCTQPCAGDVPRLIFASWCNCDGT
jgi:hypothetical protein